MGYDDKELRAAQQRVAAHRPPDADVVDGIYAQVRQLAVTEKPASLRELRRLIADRGIGTGHRAWLEYVLMDMMDRRELDAASGRQPLIINVASS